LCLRLRPVRHPLPPVSGPCLRSMGSKVGGCITYHGADGTSV
jgi:hypothetical protein